ncbi:peptidyl-prolyl isomerase CWC27-like [Teratosphaeria destructans]|uniref:Peptidyl-prolyl isomerase CWC27-like n=1 Tax=Teratosphaeria destructans TaxID=418781 RepID=A0A9W7VZJ9_9PEZI|nr:peptidyl-prolyl isomerase CWC27-like [Teratosphaeria destructans]
MSSLYNLEPPPTAKVILKTTAGDIELSLFAKQTPFASRNFLQHCLDGYYNNTIFHRLVPGFIIQGGDPTGTGSGGTSAINNGDGFEDEVHSRLKFNRRGLLGMAKDEGGSNGSQFFFTLGVTPELQGKHTMFGRVEGDTIYNLMKMAEAELAEGDGSERPLYPTKITGAEILVNPFADMVARVQEAPRTKDDGEKVQPKKRKKPVGKNVLSFVGDEGQDEAAPVFKKTKANPKLISVGEDQPEKLSNTAVPDGKGAKKAEKKQRQRTASPEVIEMPSRPAAPKPTKKPLDDMEFEDEEPEPRPKEQSQLDKTNAEIAALKASMKRIVEDGPKERQKPKSALEAMIPETSTRGRKRGKVTDERGAMDLFKAFKQQLEGLSAPDPSTVKAQNNENSTSGVANGHNPEPTTTEASADDEEAALCDLHFIANCQSCKSWDKDEKADADGADDDDGNWMAHTLTFAKDTLGKDLEWKRKMEEIEIIDPREKARMLKEERRREKGDRGKEKAGFRR